MEKLNLEIHQDFTFIIDAENPEKQIKQKTCDVLGNIIAMLEKEFPDIGDEDQAGDAIMNGILEEFNGKRKPHKIWGLKERGTALFTFNMFIKEMQKNKEGVVVEPLLYHVNLKDVEELRRDTRIRTAPILSSNGELSYSGIQTVIQALYGILYYYGINEYTIKKCEFCGKLYAVQKETRKRFCDRSYEYTDWEEKEKKYISCNDARTDIYNRSLQRYRTIYKRLDTGPGKAHEMQDDFWERCNEYRKKIKAHPSAENIIGYERFLYVDCETLFPKYNLSKDGRRRK